MHSLRATPFSSQLPRLPTMDANSQQSKGGDGTLSSLNVAIETLNLAKEAVGIAPAKAAFGIVSILLTMVRDSKINERDYVELILSCGDICTALHRGMDGKKLDDLSQSVRGAINQLRTTVAEIERKVMKRSGRNVVSRLFHAKNDKDAIAAWKLDLNRILHVFNTELAINAHMILVDMYRAVLAGQENSEHRHPTQASTSPGELPPPPPKACFGRDELIERIIGHAENHTPIALIGAGGIGKTSVALVVLHHDRIKERFGRHRRFIRCDQFPASHTSFLNRLSKVIGAGVENPEDLTPLRSSLSSNEMFIVLDNAESILDPRGANSQDIYGVVEELSRLNNICLCITSRITTIPPDCKCLGVPALSMDAAHNAFYRIYDNGDRPDLINDILGQLDFHPLSITLLATVAYENKWDSARLTREWERRQTNVLQTEHNKSLAAAIELSLASPTFQELGPDTRELLGVVAFFPQGVDEKNLDWLFPTSPNSTNTFDKFCILSLTYRSNGFVTMLAPFRDYFSPKDPKSSPLLCRTKERYFTRMSVDLNPDEPGFEEARWIASEDVNVEHLLDVFTSIDADSDDVWDACANFTRHLYRHKMRLIVLRPKIEGLGDGHPSKPQCLYHLALLLGTVGNHVELKRLLTHTLKLERERGNDCQIAETLRLLSEANQLIGLYEEGIRQARESLEISERLRDTAKQGRSLDSLAWLLWKDDQLDAAEEAEFRAINLLSKKGHQYQVCQCHQVLGHIYRSKGNREKAIYHFEVALGIASTFDWHDHLFRVHYSLALLFAYEDRLDDAHAHIEQAKSHAADNAYYLGLAMEMQAKLWYEQHQFKEAKSDVLRAVDAYEKVGAATDVERCRELLQKIQKELNSPDALDFRRHRMAPSRKFIQKLHSFRAWPLAKHG